MKRKKVLMMFAVLAVSLAATSLILNVVKRQEIESGISSKVVRFHVRAQSNSDEDQEIKLKVRDDVLQTAEMLLSGCKTREECIEILEKNTELIEKTAQQSVYENGGKETVSAEIRKEIFPLKKYGSLTFPAGQYTAFVVEIGEGKGKNWWCVMFPQICFVDECVVTEKENAAEKLGLILDEDEYNLVTGDVKIGFKIAEILEEIL